mmetsp:Transcript_20018/g.76744  ORF Transcript_20018/g.76744 Transcript_20018/m.76744 type:complete len:235 (-) Transcript_20018:60-764(-)
MPRSSLEQSAAATRPCLRARLRAPLPPRERPLARQASSSRRWSRVLPATTARPPARRRGLTSPQASPLSSPWSTSLRARSASSSTPRSSHRSRLLLGRALPLPGLLGTPGRPPQQRTPAPRPCRMLRRPWLRRRRRAPAAPASPARRQPVVRAPPSPRAGRRCRAPPPAPGGRACQEAQITPSGACWAAAPRTPRRRGSASSASTAARCAGWPPSRRCAAWSARRGGRLQSSST